MSIRTQSIPEQAVNGGQPEFLRLFSASYPEIKRVLVMFVADANDAEDLLQETSVVLWERFGEYDRQRSFTAWACGIAANKARQFLRNRYRKKSFGLSDAALANIAKVTSGTSELLELRLDTLDDCLASLPTRDRQMLWECYGDGVKSVAWAKKHQTPAGTVRNRLHRLRKWLEQCIHRRLGTGQEPQP
ncbi:sigma-70 family RNA polymerase sigma factor [Calycomorphotria hydatis]|uniref:ECF RNA polymerase sigma factor SigH n=1 Tax=Calycomorphotria hydatis TaxID=2528027 RepID=A0A517TFB4_9PLAN|nr:sigma-70 family RNA polymerase sigma factor [Calycomorphotria hydatis]QDT67048.1 ECF RNA polymerase sigma factor SigH [Calycomorphotria hydatis]